MVLALAGLLASNEKPRRGDSVPGRLKAKNRHPLEGYCMLYSDYFADTPLHGDKPPPPLSIPSSSLGISSRSNQQLPPPSSLDSPSLQSPAPSVLPRRARPSTSSPSRISQPQDLPARSCARGARVPRPLSPEEHQGLTSSSCFFLPLSYLFPHPELLCLCAYRSFRRRAVVSFPCFVTSGASTSPEHHVARSFPCFNRARRHAGASCIAPCRLLPPLIAAGHLSEQSRRTRPRRRHGLHRRDAQLASARFLDGPALRPHLLPLKTRAGVCLAAPPRRPSAPLRLVPDAGEPSRHSFAKSLASRSSSSPPAVAAATSAAPSAWGFSCPPAAVPARFWRISGAEPPPSCSTPTIRNRLPSSDPVDPRRRAPPVGPISLHLHPFLAPTAEVHHAQPPALEPAPSSVLQ
ncbi:uncharacterized protein [Aegilops tauschii subsp. strangulata]|uniref:uncharacterized protein n=1 Tax=Aegilops tauschii subsp. strangulata TaxID=200361 RepID=UPI001E1CAE00|nr:proline-rich protein 36-like [Aegilops tauschii subsp. strangulata]